MSTVAVPRPFAALLCGVLVIGSAASVVAGKVVCPVCGETHEETVVECPNDGTNLKLVGVPAKSPGANEVDREDESSADEETRDNRKGKPAIKYKRHDKGGERKPAERSEGSGYSDRMSRIPGDTRYAAEPKPVSETPEARPEPFPTELDEEIRSDFERQRQYAMKHRKASEPVETGEKNSAKSKKMRILNRMGAPLTSLGFRVFWMAEGNDSGPVGTAEIDVNLVRYRLRAGFSTLLGLRDLEHRNELIFLENISVGFQSLKRFSPYIVARGGIGMVKTERYHTDQFYLLTSLGFEVGVDSWVTQWIALTPSMGYMRCTVSDAYWHSFTGKISIGF